MEALQQLVDDVMKVKQEPEDDDIIELSSDEEPSSSTSTASQSRDPTSLLLNPALNPRSKTRKRTNGSSNSKMNSVNEKNSFNNKCQPVVYGTPSEVHGPKQFGKFKKFKYSAPVKKIPRLMTVEEMYQIDPRNLGTLLTLKQEHNLDTITDSKDTIISNIDTITDNKDTINGDKDNITDNKDTIISNIDTITDNKDTISNMNAGKIPFYKKSQLNRRRMLPAILNELPNISQVVVTEKFLDIPNAPIFNRVCNPKLPQLKKRPQRISPTEDFFKVLFPNPHSTNHIPRPYKSGALFNLPEKEDLIPGVEMRLLVSPMDISGIKKPNASGDDAGEYEVEKVLLKNIHIDKNPYYLLKWAGYGYGELSWEAESSLDCTELVKEFHDRRNVSSIIYNNMSLEEREHYPGFLTKYLHGMTDSLIMDGYIFEGALDEFNKKNGFGKLIVENWTDDSELPLNWKPIPKNIHTNAVRMELIKAQSEKQCSCEQCSVSTCPCMTVRIQHGYIHANVNVITECNDLCDCKHCPPRTFNKGRQEPLILFKNRKSGFSLRASRDIREGRFIVEYVGVVKTVEECKDIEDVTYLFELDFSKNAKFIIDASEYGNEARFINHSCEPNLAVVMCFGAVGDRNMYKVYFFAARDIYAGEELTFNYFGAREVPTTDLPSNVPRCHCGSTKCRKYLY